VGELRVHAGLDPETRRKRYVTRTFRGSAREADKALAKLVSEVDSGTVVAYAATMSDLCERWFGATRTSWSPTVVASYRSILDHYVLLRWGATQLRRLRADDLDAWYATLHRSGGVRGVPLSPNTVGRIHAVVRRALNQAVKWGWLAGNPASSATPPRVRRQL
jgi:hypothetical protein